MSRISTIGVRFEADYDRARQQYDEYRRYVETHPPRVAVEMSTAPPGAAGGTASTSPTVGGTPVTTFGGQTVITNPSPSVTYPGTAAGPVPISPSMQARLDDRYNSRLENRMVADRMRLERAGEADSRGTEQLDRAISDAAYNERRYADQRETAWDRATRQGERADRVQIDQPEGGGGGGRGFFNRGFGRMISAFYITKEIENLVAGDQQYNIQMGQAGSDPRMQYSAIKARRDQIFATPIVGYVASQFSDPGGVIGANNDAMIKSGDARTAALAARGVYQDYRKGVADTAEVLGTAPSGRAVAAAGLAFDAAMEDRNKRLKPANDADIAARDARIDAANQAYTNWATPTTWQYVSGGSGRNAGEDYDRRKARDAEIEAAKNAFHQTLIPAAAGATEREQLAAPLREALRTQTQSQRLDLAEAVHTAAQAAATGSYAAAVVGGGAGPNFAAEQKLQQQTHEASEALTLAKYGFVAYNSQVTTDRAAEDISRAQHTRDMRLSAAERRGQIEQTYALASDNPHAAELAGINTRYNADLAKLDVHDQRGRDELNIRRENEITAANRSYGFNVETIRNSQATQAAQTRAGLARSPEIADAIGIAGGGINQALGLQRSGHAAEAQQQLENTRLGLDLYRQNYLDNFRGAQTDLRNIDTQGPKDSQDPGAVIEAIHQLETGLGQRFADELSKVAAAK